MKNLLARMAALLLLGALLAGCAGEPWEPALGEYVYEDAGEALPASVTLQENNAFQFVDSPLSSYLIAGTYEVEGDRMICTTDDGKFSYVFERSGDDLAFQAEDSSELRAYVQIPDGAVFQLSDPL